MLVWHSCEIIPRSFQGNFKVKGVDFVCIKIALLRIWVATGDSHYSNVGIEGLTLAVRGSTLLVRI